MIHIKDKNIFQNEPTAVMLGNFDGMHMGHRMLAKTTLENAKKENLKSVVFTFSPHPRVLFGGGKEFLLILSPEEKKYLIESMGFDIYIEYPFSKEFSSLSPEEFAVDLIFKQLNCKVLVVGYDYRFGKKQAGDYKLLKEYGDKYGVKVFSVDEVDYESERVSSTRIRNCLTNGEIEKANRLMTMPYFIKGKVAEGKKLGRTIGFPTINIIADDGKLFPINGVYATRSLVEGKIYSGVTNIGVNPTVNGTRKIVETYLFDFDGDVYGKDVVTWVFKFIRAERKFEDVGALQKQLISDANSSREYFLTEDFAYWSNNY